ncbi:MAG: hypothetical protein PHR16_01560 [Methylovulum sp.]|nr:hypothetical protein [Methylovulum sp.]
MKRFILTGIVLLGGVTGEALAICAGTKFTASSQTVTLLSGKTICQRPTPASDWEWQEYHTPTVAFVGNIIDYKKGPADPVDPTKTVGTYSINSRGGITYTYTGGGSYAFTIFDQGSGVYNFCDATGNTVQVSGATVKPGQVSCN